MPATAVLEAPVAPAVTPAPAVPAPTPKFDAESFMKDSAGVTPDVLTKLTMPYEPPKIVQRGQPPKAAPVVPAVVPPVAPAVEPAAVAPVEPVAPTPEPEKTLAKNWRLQAEDAKDALYMQLRKAGAGHMDAHAEVYGQPSAPVTEPISEPEVTQPDPVLAADGNIQKLASSMAELTGKIDEAAAANDIATVVKLQREHSATMLQHADAVRNRESIAQDLADRQVSTAVEFHRQQESTSLESIREAHPELGDKKSDKRAQFNLMAAELENNPAYGKNFRNNIPAWPEIVANAADRKYGWSLQTAPVVPAPVAPKIMNQPENPLAPKLNPQPIPPVRATSAEVISPSSNLGGAVPQVSGESFWRDSANLPPAVLIDLMKHAPTPEFLRKGQNKNDPRRFGIA